MDLIALALALKALDFTEQQAAAVIAAYIEEHPEAIAEVTVAVPDELTAYLGMA